MFSSCFASMLLIALLDVLSINQVQKFSSCLIRCCWWHTEGKLYILAQLEKKEKFLWTIATSVGICASVSIAKC